MKYCLIGVIVIALGYSLDGYSSSAPIEKQADDIQKFALYTYRDLIADFAKNGGIYVDALLEMCEVPSEYKANYVHILKSMLHSTSDKFSFARMLSDNFKNTKNCIKV